MTTPGPATDAGATGDGFVPVPLDPVRGFPQTVPAQAGTRRLQVTLAVATSDLPALLSTPATQAVVDIADGTARRTADPPDIRGAFRASSPPSLGPGALRAALLVRDGDTVLGTAPALPGTILRFGTAGAVAELRVDALVLPAGVLLQPGAVGGMVRIGVRAPVPAVPPVPPPTATEDLYASLV